MAVVMPMLMRAAIPPALTSAARAAYPARATTSAGYAAAAGTRCAAGRRFSRSLTALMTRE